MKVKQKGQSKYSREMDEIIRRNLETTTATSTTTKKDTYLERYKERAMTYDLPTCLQKRI